MEDKGYVYIITNKYMPECIKIGQTKNIRNRLKELDGTNLPVPYEPFFSVKTSKYIDLEKTMHNILSTITNTRIRDNREFFEMKPEDALIVLKEISKYIDDAEMEDYGNETISNKDPNTGELRIISANTTFEMLGIPIGSSLEPISPDLPHATTIDGKNHIRLDNGEEKSISRAVVDIKGFPVNGFSYYKYNGEKLQDIRARIDNSYFLNRI